jgi:putative salt-induced outer membrane protein
MPKQSWLAIVGFCLSPSVLVAQTWSGHADLGYSATGGNTDSQSLNAEFGLAYTEGSWQHKAQLEALRSSQDGDAEAERYQFGAKTEYSLNSLSYLFGSLDYEHDAFGGIRARTTAATGYGRRLLNTDQHKLSIEAGPGLRQLRRQDGEREREAIARAALDYLWQLSPTSVLSQALLLETGQADTYTESVSALKLKIAGNLAAKLSYTVKHHSDVPVGLEKTDTYTLVALSYEFGETPAP